LGTPAAGNIPGSRNTAASWTDSSGHLWLFGGIGVDAGGYSRYLNDLWEFNPSTDEWAWMGGSTTGYQSGVYGTLGTPAAGNIPGDRSLAASWTDSSGHFWLFGGEGLDASDNFGLLNDLWEFDPFTDEWTWMGGSSTISCVSGNCGQPGVYGTLGTPAGGNIPGGRGGASTWTDNSGNLWLFGGAGLDVDGKSGALNDTWEFNPSADEWAWMGGSSVANQSEVYGTLGTPAAGNTPGGRYSAASWTDNSGNLWLFGGAGYDASGNSGDFDFNDLWEFSPYTDEWAWMGGSSVANQSGVYGTLGTPAAGNTPGGRFSAASWTDSSGHFWLFGGAGYDASGNAGDFNDLWEFSPYTDEWVWMGGSSAIAGGCNDYYTCGQSGAYGTLGTPAAGNIPGSRYTAANWTDSSGHFWLFGGEGFDASLALGELSDLWEYEPSTAPLPTAATPTFSAAAGNYAAAQTVTISDATDGPTIYYTTDGTTPTANSTVYSGPITVSSTETLEAIATASGCLTSAVASAAYTINLPQAATPTFSVPAGTYTTVQTVTISDATAGATIYYTTNGTTPTTSSTNYTAAIPVATTETIQAIAVASGYTTSGVASATYTIPPNFSVAAAPASLTVTAGNSGTTTVTIAPEGGFNAAVSFACSGLPSGASCSFSPATVTPSGGAAATTTLTVATSTTTAALSHNGRPLFPEAALAVFLFCYGWKKRPRLQMLLLLAVSVIGLSLLSACGGGGSSSGGTISQPQPVTSTVTVTATSGSLQQTTTFSLTVN
jgi:N-acetylneuraminic acid mutarotase